MPRNRILGWILMALGAGLVLAVLFPAWFVVLIIGLCVVGAGILFTRC